MTTSGDADSGSEGCLSARRTHAMTGTAAACRYRVTYAPVRPRAPTTRIESLSCDPATATSQCFDAARFSVFAADKRTPKYGDGEGQTGCASWNPVSYPSGSPRIAKRSGRLAEEVAAESNACRGREQRILRLSNSRLGFATRTLPGRRERALPRDSCESYRGSRHESHRLQG